MTDWDSPETQHQVFVEYPGGMTVEHLRAALVDIPGDRFIVDGIGDAITAVSIPKDGAEDSDVIWIY